MNYKIFPPDGILEAEIVMPLSKSICNRSLIINALTDSPASIDKLAKCTDTDILLKALTDTSATEINVNDAGTAMRFLTAYFASRPGRQVTLDGNDRMRQRPIGPLVDALRACGAEIHYSGVDGYPPLKINGRRLVGGNIEIGASVSSQFISAILMIAPTMLRGISLTMTGDAVSLPYIDLTLDLMQRSGIKCERSGSTITVPPGEYRPTALPAEGDWSAAAFWYEIEALTGGFLTLSNLNTESKQPDRRAMDLFGQLGAVTEQSYSTDCIELVGSPDVSPRLTVDLSPTPDLAPAVAVTCSMIGVPFRITGLETLKIKETDRLEAIAAELRKIGVMTEISGGNAIEWDGKRLPVMEIPVFETYGDHRMAMALAPVATYIPGIIVRDIEVTAKSYPEFWNDMQKAGFELADADSITEQTEEE